MGQGSEGPSDCTSLLLTTAQFSGAGTQTEKVATESVDRIRLSRDPHMQNMYLSPNGAQLMDRALEYFRRVAKHTDSPLARAVANEREYICEATRVPFAPYAPSGAGLAPPMIRPVGLTQTPGAFRALSRAVKDAFRVETPAQRVRDACFGCMLKCNMPASKGPLTPANVSKFPRMQVNPLP